MNSTEPTHKFELEMLDPDYWEPSKLRTEVTISTDEWLRMQCEAMNLVNDERVCTVTPLVAVTFWKSIIYGKVPTLLRIVGPDPMTRIS